MNSIYTIIKIWIKTHYNTKVSIVVDLAKGTDSPLAKVNLKTRKIVLYMEKIIIVAEKLQLPVNILLYYTISHELGHLLYQVSDRKEIEEYFAHNYAVRDTKSIYSYIKKPCRDIIYSKLESIQKILLL